MGGYTCVSHQTYTESPYRYGTTKSPFYDYTKDYNNFNSYTTPSYDFPTPKYDNFDSLKYTNFDTSKYTNFDTSSFNTNFDTSSSFSAAPAADFGAFDFKK